MVLFNISKPMNRYKWGILIGCVIAIILSFMYFKDFFGLADQMTLQGILLCVNFSIMTEAMFRYVYGLFGYIEKGLAFLSKKVRKKKK